jgi:hypothetical protein
MRQTRKSPSGRQIDYKLSNYFFIKNQRVMTKSLHVGGIGVVFVTKPVKAVTNGLHGASAASHGAVHGI